MPSRRRADAGIFQDWQAQCCGCCGGSRYFSEISRFRASVRIYSANKSVRERTPFREGMENKNTARRNSHVQSVRTVPAWQCCSDYQTSRPGSEISRQPALPRPVRRPAAAIIFFAALFLRLSHPKKLKQKREGKPGADLPSLKTHSASAGFKRRKAPEQEPF